MSNSITDPPPADVAAEVTAFVAALDQVIPAKQNQNLLIGTWNVRAFNRLTPSGVRLQVNLLCVISATSSA
jgi:hypothetical protein